MDNYIKLSIVGEGTYGIVMKCLNKSTGLPVAVKKLRNTIHSHSYYCEMIVREISLLKMLSHEHVVLMIEAFRDHGYIYMVFPFMLCNLYKHLEQNGGVLTVDCTKECMYQVFIIEKLSRKPLTRTHRGYRGCRINRF